jgi:hypothetical protein
MLASTPASMLNQNKPDSGIPKSIQPNLGDDTAAVGAEDGASHVALVPGEGGERLSGLGVPQPRGFVIRGGDDVAAVGAERGTKNRALMPSENGEFVRHTLRCVERILRLGHVGPEALDRARSRAVRECFQREQHARGGVALFDLRVSQISQEP